MEEQPRQRHWKWIVILGLALLVVALARTDGAWSGVAYANGTLPSWCPSVPTVSPCPAPTVPTFSDVSPSDWFYDWVETIACYGYIAGRPDGTYGPLDSVTRAETAVFVERAINGPGFTPSVPSVGSFTDVDYATPVWYAKWAEALYQDGMTAGCAGSIPGVDLQYCPDTNHTRAETAVFFERVIHGAGFTPTVPTVGSFVDVDYATPIWYAKWVEGIYQDEVVAGCSGSVPGVDLAYCPDTNATRAELSVFMVRSLCLPIIS
jgi:hypothetical protein